MPTLLSATGSYLHAGSGTKVGMLGYSGAAIATEWASELAPSYAPGLHIVGAADGGVPVDFAHNLTYINGDQNWAGVIPAVLVSLGRAFGVDITPYLSAYGEQVTSQVSGECIASFAAAYPGLTVQSLLGPQYQDPFKIPVLVTILNKLIMGTGGTPAEPVLLGAGNADGTGDGIMIAGDVEGLAHEYCQRGVPVSFDVYDGLQHTPRRCPSRRTRSRSSRACSPACRRPTAARRSARAIRSRLFRSRNAVTPYPYPYPYPDRPSEIDLAVPPATH